MLVPRGPSILWQTADNFKIQQKTVHVIVLFLAHKSCRPTILVHNNDYVMGRLSHS